MSKTTDGAVTKCVRRNEVIVYKPEVGVEITTQFDGKDFYISQADMAKMFTCTKRNIQKHIKNALEEELNCASPTNYLFVGANNVHFYNLDAVLSVGYRVKSPRGVEFRRWANRMLRERLTNRPAAPAPAAAPEPVAVSAPAERRPLPWNPNISDAQNYASRYFEMERLVDGLRRKVEQGLDAMDRRVESHEEALNIILKVNDLDRELLKSFARHNWELKQAYYQSREER